MITMTTRRAGRLAADWAVCLFTALATASGSTGTVAGWLPHYAIVPLAAGQGLVLLARRREPTAVLAATTAVGVFMIVTGYSTGSASFGVCCAAYAAAVYRPGGEGTDLTETLRHAAAAMVAAVAVGLATLSPEARIESKGWGTPTAGALIAASWVLGYAIRTRRAYIAELEDRAARLEAEEGERAARAVIDERLRIARELHDVIGHSISLITIQAEAATRSVRVNPDAVPGFLTRISAASRQALAEMRHALAVMRPDAAAELGPAPGLADLGELVERLNAGGLETRLDVEPTELSPGVALTVYRIVQESLTNVLKHAGPGASAAVTVVRGESSVRVSVQGDGAGPGREHGARHRRDVRARGRLRRDAAHRRPGERRVRGRSAHPGARGGTMTITVLIVDDQALVRSGLRAIIESEPGMEVVGEAGDGAEAVEAVRRLRPDVALMDIRMPRLDGVAATRALLRGAAPVRTRIMILTTFHVDDYVTGALRAGASGFLLKESTGDQLVQAVRVVCAGEAMLAPSVTRRLLERMAEDSAAAAGDGRELRSLLSAREVDVLLLVARGLSNAEIGTRLHLAETTVKSHVQSMLGKLGVRDRLQAAVAAYDSGLVRPGGH